MSQLNAILIFSAVIFAIEAMVMIIRGTGYGPWAVRLMGISLVVLVALILAFSDIPKQRSAAYALLGVAAGYLAGKPGAGEG
jgi:hypothetical protein